MSGRHHARLVVYNTDGVNPYAMELAALLADQGLPTDLMDPRNSAHRPPAGVRWRRLLPENFGSGGKVLQSGRLIRGLSAAVLGSAARGDTLLLAWTRTWVEMLVFAGLASTRRPVIVVAHNPVARAEESALKSRARRWLMHRSQVVVVHAERLRGQLAHDVRAKAVVCPHPPYLQTAKAEATAPATGATGTRWVAFVGALRWDKGFELVPELLSRVSADTRRGLGLVVCGHGDVPEEALQRVRELGIAVRDLTSSTPVPQATLLGVLAEQPLVLAPYVAATQSGTVILALSTGCRVLAFAEGGIPDVLGVEGLVATGDLDAMARAVEDDRGGHSVMTPIEWGEHAGRSWAAIVRASSRHTLDATR